jgi:hypothetical protein
MMIYQDGTRMAFAVGDLYGQEFAVGEDFKAEDYHVHMHYGINYLLSVGDDMTEIHFECPQVKGATEPQLLAVLIDRITRQAMAAERPPFADLLRLRDAEFHLRRAMEHLEEIDGNP